MTTVSESDGVFVTTETAESSEFKKGKVSRYFTYNFCIKSFLEGLIVK